MKKNVGGEVLSVTSSRSPEQKVNKLRQAISGVDDNESGNIKVDLLLNLIDCVDMNLSEDAHAKIRSYADGQNVV